MARKSFRDAVKFFAQRSGAVGHSWESGLHLARAEHHADCAGFTFTWEHDNEPDLGDHEYWCPTARLDKARPLRGGYKRCEHEVLSCLVRDSGGTIVGSLGGIIDPDRDYRRVIEAELSLEAIEASKPAPARAPDSAPMSGYIDCACRDCFDIAIGPLGTLCHDCRAAGCDAFYTDCRRDDAYGATEQPEVTSENYIDATAGLYWYAANHHAGQGSALYRVLSALEYNPGACERGPDQSAQEFYSALQAGADPEAMLAAIKSAADR